MKKHVELDDEIFEMLEMLAQVMSFKHGLRKRYRLEAILEQLVTDKLEKLGILQDIPF